MTATTALRTVAAPDAALRARGIVVLVGGCAGLAALSLNAPWALAFDPLAWLVWGREVTRGAVDTSAGPSWKPLPVVVTTPLTVFGDAAPGLWLVVARTGALLAVAGAAALAARLGGRAAGVGAAAALVLGPWWAYGAALGNSEGLLAAALLWAILAHLDDRPGPALGLGVAAGLLRPEVWPFLFLYAAWLWRSGLFTPARLSLALAPLPLLWLGPDLIGAGGALEASHHALGTPTPGSAGNAAVPALAVVWDAIALLTIPATLAALASGREARRFALAVLAWVLLVALETQAGYAGNPRYLAGGLAAGAVLAGVGAARVGARLGGAGGGVGAARVGARGGLVAATVLGVAVLAVSFGELRVQARDVVVRDESRRGLDRLVAVAGGAPALRACAPIRTSAAMRASVAWRLDLPMRDLEAPPRAPTVLFRARLPRSDLLVPPPPRGLALVARAPRWELWRACAARTPQ